MFAMGLKSCGNMLITRLIALPSIALATSVLSGVDRRIGIALDITIGHYHWTLPLDITIKVVQLLCIKPVLEKVDKGSS